MFNHVFFGFQFYDLLYYYFIYACMGWCIESIYASWIDARLVNRGFLNGPVCPIYGFGALILIIVLRPVMDNILLLFIGAVILTSVLEYITSLALEKAFKHKWWDYSSRFFNVQGRICLVFSLYWGMFSILMLKILHPQVVDWVAQIPINYGIIGLLILLLYFLGDFILSLSSLIDLNALIVQMHSIRLEVKETLEHITGTSLEGIEDTIGELKGKYETLHIKIASKHQRLLIAFPTIRSKHYEHILHDIKDRMSQL